MVWFQCDDCGDSVKKPKVQAHFGQCAARTFTCIDCSRHFDRNTYKAHNTCVTEHEKYAKGATKPGGHAANGFFSSDAAAGAAAASPAADAGEAVVGAEYLSSRPPWKCSICNVSATSQETLQGHAAGMKHKRRVKAVKKAAEATEGSAAVVPDERKAGEQANAGGETAAEAAPLANGSAAAAAASDGPAANGSATAAPKRKRAEAAAMVSEPTSGAAAPSKQQPADKPRKKSKAKAAGSDAATAQLAAETNGVVSPSTVEVAKKRKKVAEPAADVAAELAAQAGGQKPGKKGRKQSKEEPQPASVAAGTAPEQQDEAVTFVASERVASQTPKQNGESRRLKAGAAGGQKQAHEATESGEDLIPASTEAAVKGSVAEIQQSIEQREAALQRMRAAGLTPPNAELRKLRKEKKAAQAAARAHESGSPPGQWEAAAVQRLRKLGAGGELAVKALQKELIKAAKKAMQEQWKRSAQLVIEQGKMKLVDGVQ